MFPYIGFATKCAELQDALASSEAQREQLEQQLAAAATAAAAGAAVGGTDATLARRSSGGGGGSVEMEMLRVEVAQLRDTLQLAESARRGAEKAAAAARDELGAHVGGAGQAAEARVLDLEQQLREMSEALVAKQGQLEKLSADKAASQVGDKAVARVCKHVVQLCAHRTSHNQTGFYHRHHHNCYRHHLCHYHLCVLCAPLPPTVRRMLQRRTAATLRLSMSSHGGEHTHGQGGGGGLHVPSGFVGTLPMIVY